MVFSRMLKKSASGVLASLRSSTRVEDSKRSETLDGFFRSPRHIVRANGAHEVLFVPPRIFACCGLACGKARLGAPGLGG